MIKFLKFSFLSLHILLFLHLLTEKVNAQYIERSVISNSGTFFSGVNYQIDFTLGEFAINQYFLAQYTCLQGFHQPRICFGDLNNDGLINTGDVLLFFVEYACIENCGPADFDNDGEVSTNDLLFLLSLYGTSCDQV